MQYVNPIFKCISYTGNGTTQTITSVGFQPDLVWIKNRDATDSHQLFDSTRGVTKAIHADSTVAEAANDDTLTAFGSTGFSLGDDVVVNTNNEEYVAWCWKMAGGTTTAFTESGNNPGGTHQANTTSGTSIVTYTGTGSNGTIKHDSETDYLILNTSAASADSANWWNDTAATDSVFTVATDHSVNADGEKYVAYCFADVQDYQKVGIYLGNNSTTGATVWTGFKPAYVLTKKLDGTGNWYINDIARSPGNPTSSFGDNLYTDSNNAESGNGMDLISTGFKIRNADSSQNSNDGDCSCAI